jgi:hypothetical protein
MVEIDDAIVETATSASVENVIQDWKELMTDEWVEEILAKPNTAEQVYHLATKFNMSLPDAWANYFSLQFTSQI